MENEREMEIARKLSKEICNECGESVAEGSGKFVNRVSDFNTVEERVEMGKPYPEGDYVCAECDGKIREAEANTTLAHLDEDDKQGKQEAFREQPTEQATPEETVTEERKEFPESPKVAVKVRAVEGGLTDVIVAFDIVDVGEAERLGQVVLKKPYDSLHDFEGLAQKIQSEINREIAERYVRIKKIFPDYEVKMNLQDFANHYTANFELSHPPISTPEEKNEDASTP